MYVANHVSNTVSVIPTSYLPKLVMPDHVTIKIKSPTHFLFNGENDPANTGRATATDYLGNPLTVSFYDKFYPSNNKNVKNITVRIWSTTDLAGRTAEAHQVITFVEKITISDEPTNLNVTSSNKKQQVSLSWDSPMSDGGSTITDYIIKQSVDGGSTWSVVTVANGDTVSAKTTATIKGLTTGTAYTFQVFAKNVKGTETIGSSYS